VKIDVHLVKSFTRDPEQGSPTGVVLDAELENEQMQYIAAELGFAESVFVRSPTAKGAPYRPRFFAPEQEVDLCGHATIAAFHLLMEQGKIAMSTMGHVALMQETRAGTLPVTCYEDGRVVMQQKDPEFGAIEKNYVRIGEMLGITPGQMLCGMPSQIISTGTPKLLVPLADARSLRAVRQNVAAIEAYCHDTGARGVYPFTAESPIPGTDFYARQFNPLADKNEDPITGVAAGALGCYAAKYFTDARQFIVAQGYDMGMGGNMVVDVSDGVHVGGYAVTYGQTQLEI
jgi:trans-2,3-dihydro-3-hydroxyanthranilate isomerase